MQEDGEGEQGTRHEASSKYCRRRQCCPGFDVLRWWVGGRDRKDICGKQATAARSNISIKCEPDTASRSTRRAGEERTQFSYLMSLEKKLIWQWNPSCFAASDAVAVAQL